MKQLMSIPLGPDTATLYPDLKTACADAGCDGIEGMWCGLDLPQNVPPEVRVGYHLAYYPTWLDFWRENRNALDQEFGSEAVWTGYYGGKDRSCLLDYFRRDLARAKALDAEYVVFHVAEVSLEEHYTRQWRHSHEKVIDAAAELLNQLLSDCSEENDPLLLVENQWLPGFTFTDPDLTARLLDSIDYPNKGIMLDIGHLMNCNQDLTSEEEGAAWVHQLLDAHEELCRYIRGVHLHQSLSGAYVRSHSGPDALPKPWPEDYYDRLRLAYGHLYQTDWHEPWHSSAIRPVLDRLSPDYVVHELRNTGPEDYLRKIRLQQEVAGLI